MAYKVIKKFRDKDGKIYDPEDPKANTYPFSTVSKERLEELSTDKNDYGYPFIEEVKEAKKPAAKKAKKEAGE